MHRSGKIPLEPLRVFVYGTLKRGLRNHEEYCAGYRSVAAAAVRGRLYQLASGVPVVEIPSDDALAVGTSVPRADLQIQILTPVPGELVELDSDTFDWVEGELFEFDDVDRLERLDELEEFQPRKMHVWYRRVLVPVRLAEDGRLVSAWIYTLSPEDRSKPLGTVWPPAAG